MSTKDTVKREADSASQKLSEAQAAAKSKAQEIAGEAQNTAQAYAEEGKQAAAMHLNDFARAVRRASDELSERDKGLAARVVTEAADGLEKVANSVSGTSVDEMLGSVQTFARRNPGAFMLGAVLAGVALGRFAKASSERSHDDFDDDYGGPPSTGGTVAPSYATPPSTNT